MAVEYGRRGLIGTLTPQANTTVEPEFRILFPAGIASINARMTSSAPDMAQRLVEYFDRLPEWAAQFANAPVDVIAVACTGASYLAGPSREQALLDHTQAACSVPVITSGQAVVAALRALAAQRVAFVSPYPRALTEASLAYWSAFGFQAARVIEVGGATGAFHPIYAMAADSAESALAALDNERGLDALVMLGTGMPTLGPILARPTVAGAPVLSCMLATAWRSVLQVDKLPPTRDSLLAWIREPEWAAPFHASR